jgi:hypothetical protein
VVQQVDGHAPPIEEYDPNPVPGQPPREMAANGNGGPPGMAQRVPPHERRERDPNMPPEGRETAVSHAGAPLPERGYPKRIMWLTLPDVYDDMHVKAWVNFPQKVITDVEKTLRQVRSPDDRRVDPDDVRLDPDDWALDPDEYGISDDEVRDRLAEKDRRIAERQRRSVEKARRQEAFDAAYAQYARVMGEIVIEHDFHIGPDGALLPPADTVEFWDAIEGELTGVMMKAITAEQGKLNPKTARR